MSRSDWLKLLLIGAIVCGLLEVPYVLARWCTPEGYVFRGSFWAPHDLSQYLSAAHQGAEKSSWLIYNKLTPEEHSPALIFPLYGFLGHLAAQFHFQIEQAYSVLLVFSRISLIFAVYWFVSAYVLAAHWRRYGTLLVLFSSGFGAWFAIGRNLLGAQMITDGFLADLNAVEMNTFLVFLSYPHIMLALGALFVSARAWLLYLGNGHSGWLAALFMGLIAIGFLNPFNIVPLLAVFSGHALVLWARRCKNWRRLALGLGPTLVICLSFIAYNYLTFNNDAFWGTVYGTQNELASPNPLQLVSSLGIAAMLAMFGIRICLRKPSLERLFIVMAALVFCLLMYLPLPYQRRFSFGLHPVVVCLALLAIEHLFSTYRIGTQHGHSPEERRRRQLALIVLVVLALFTNIGLYGDTIKMVTTPVTFGNGQTTIFEPISLVSARNWFTAEGDVHQIVLAHHRTGNFLAASIPGRVFTGHWTATKDFAKKNQAVERFFSIDTEESWCRQLLSDYSITHVVYGPWERQLGLFDPRSCAYLRQTYSGDDMSIFRTVPILYGTMELDMNILVTGGAGYLDSIRDTP